MALENGDFEEGSTVDEGPSGGYIIPHWTQYRESGATINATEAAKRSGTYGLEMVCPTYGIGQAYQLIGAVTPDTNISLFSEISKIGDATLQFRVYDDGISFSPEWIELTASSFTETTGTFGDLFGLAENSSAMILIFSANGGSSGSITAHIDDIAVGDLPPTPTAGFTYTIIGDRVIFTDTSTNTPTSWLWDFGDGSPYSTEQNPVHKFTKVEADPPVIKTFELKLHPTGIIIEIVGTNLASHFVWGDIITGLTSGAVGTVISSSWNQINVVWITGHFNGEWVVDSLIPPVSHQETPEQFIVTRTAETFTISVINAVNTRPYLMTFRLGSAPASHYINWNENILDSNGNPFKMSIFEITYGDLTSGTAEGWCRIDDTDDKLPLLADGFVIVRD